MKLDTLLESADQLLDLFVQLKEAIGEGPHNISVTKCQDRRTIPQNRALHLYCENIANLMNDAGITQRELVGRFKEGFELPVTNYMIKDIFREVGRAMYQKESTADLTTVEISEVYKVVDARLGEISSCRAEWPSLR